ncbi:MAG: glutathione-disulfide reductase [Proteobacteria bacterium]|nr:glutathione-disulfide reductase [Pseudomonadota bacterium]
MSQYDVDLFVIGGGSGGVRAGRIAAEHGARVAIAEADRWGGTCVIRGCVPKKLFVYASEVSRAIDDARGQGWTIEGATFDWPTLVAGKDREIARLSAAYADRLRRAKAEVIEGRATLVDPHTLELAGGRRVTAGTVLVAVGGTPRRPPGDWITSDEAFHLPALPARLVIHGGGYIAVEFAHIFAGLGVAVTLIHREPLPLRGFDPEVREEAAIGLRAHGVDELGGFDVAERTETGVVVRDRETGDTRAIAAEIAMTALGRRPMTTELGLEACGVALDANGFISVDEWSRTNVPNIYAVGDVTGRVALTPIAIREGHAFADTVFGGRPTSITHDLIPTAVFAQPAIATVGLTEPDARARGDVRVFRARFKSMRYALTGRVEHVLIKVIVRASDDVVVGLHVVGPDAPEIVQAAAIAITMGAKKSDLDRTFAMHPTTAEELVLLR